MKFYFLIAALLIQISRAAETIEGIWRWQFSMPDGSLANPILRLKLDDKGKLVGTSSFRAGSETSITNAIFRNNDLRFQVIRARDNQPIVTTYSGRFSGTTLTGTIESNWSGETQTFPWKAEKLHGPNGTWKWPVTVGERTIDAQLTLKLDGAKLEGAIATRGRASRTKIKNGTINDDGQLSFEVETGRGDDLRLTRYKGKLAGDIITGSIESTARGVTREYAWTAQRAP